ncbi:MAG: macro domain-containing protein [Gemmatimonadota bacterium]|nr:MAG: macro domain-containing protein [Gemmatimonadota bacterium]
METDAIVNAANERLAHGGGVAGAIVRRGGRVIQEESTRWVQERGPVTVGTAAITSGGNLKAKHVIHAVGPRMGEGDEDAKLKGATLSSLELADEYGLKSITFPAISTGIFGYPLERCAPIMLTNTFAYLQGKTNLELVVFCLWDKEAFHTFQQTLEEL